MLPKALHDYLESEQTESIDSPMCNVAQFLTEQETACRDIAIVVRHSQEGHREWTTVAEDMMQARLRHAARCAKCGGQSNAQDQHRVG